MKGDHFQVALSKKFIVLPELSSLPMPWCQILHNFTNAQAFLNPEARNLSVLANEKLDQAFAAFLTNDFGSAISLARNAMWIMTTAFEIERQQPEISTRTAPQAFWYYRAGLFVAIVVTVLVGTATVSAIALKRRKAARKHFRRRAISWTQFRTSLR